MTGGAMDHVRTEERPRRSWFLTCTCLVALVGIVPVVITVPLVLLRSGTKDVVTGVCDPFYVATLIGFIGILGCWFMRRWGVYAYAAMLPLHAYLTLSSYGGVGGYMILEWLIAASLFTSLAKMR